MLNPKRKLAMKYESPLRCSIKSANSFYFERITEKGLKLREQDECLYLIHTTGILKIISLHLI